jgi:hypothetical protein
METRFDKDRAVFRGTGQYDHEIQGRLISSYLSAQLIKQLALYGVAIVFILAACFLIVFAPAGREQTTVIVAAALFAVAIGLGGFSYFKIKAPLISAEVGTVTPPQVGPAMGSHTENPGQGDDHVGGR